MISLICGLYSYVVKLKLMNSDSVVVARGRKEVVGEEGPNMRRQEKI